jgi:O-acetyl-ADP-ribose deacetylase
MAETINKYQFASRQTLEICKGDITKVASDAIVNAANSHLMHGGGVAAAIARQGGEAIGRESQEWVKMHGPVINAKPAITSGGKLPCKYVIHAVGPIWGEGDEDRKLNDAIKGSLITAEGLNVVSIAFPAISTGIFGFPKERAAKIMIRSIQDYFKENPMSKINTVKIVLIDEPTLQVFRNTFEDEFESKGKK